MTEFVERNLDQSYWCRFDMFTINLFCTSVPHYSLFLSILQERLLFLSLAYWCITVYNGQIHFKNLAACCCKIFKVCLTILVRYLLKGEAVKWPWTSIQNAAVLYFAFWGMTLKYIFIKNLDHNYINWNCNCINSVNGNIIVSKWIYANYWFWQIKSLL